ncbi:MAG: cation diffusion facilitator family transporter [Bacteroidota bacterium]|nr:cation diffusion facilitator family transporter [Bacteroidota bacterium]
MVFERHTLLNSDGDRVSLQASYRADQKRLRAAIGFTACVMVAQAVGVWYSQSLALLSDTGHVLTDFLSLGAAYLALQAAKYPLRPGSRYTYGLYRVEVLIALLSALLLLGVCVFIAWEAVQRLWAPRAVSVVPMLLAGLVGLVGNGFVVVFLHRGESLSTRAAYLHALSDMASSLAVIAGGVSIWSTGAFWVDPVLSLVLVGFIVRYAVLLLWEALGVVLEASPRMLPLRDLEAALRQLPGVSDVHDLHVWRVAPREMLLSAHLVVGTGENSEHVLTQARSLLQKRFGIHHIALQIEPPGLAQVWQCANCRYTVPGSL